jgi:hypothetical protein
MGDSEVSEPLKDFEDLLGRLRGRETVRTEYLETRGLRNLDFYAMISAGSLIT